jgi:hypothetical protein
MKQADTPSQMAAGHSSNGSVAEAYANQVDYCRSNDATITARVVAAIAVLLDRADADPFMARIRDWSGLPMADGLPLRSAGALHGLQLSGAAPELAPIYADQPADDIAIIGAVLQRHGAALLPWLDGPPQTNEAGRSGPLMAGLIEVAQRFGPKLDLLEIGSSAGLNLLIDRYRIDLGGTLVGPADSSVTLTPDWSGPPPAAVPVQIVSVRGCDVNPLDATDPAVEARLAAYVWAEKPERFQRMRRAIAMIRERGVALDRADAADWLAARLAQPQAAGVTRVLMHSVVWQYLPDETAAAICAAMAAAGARATADRPLAWVHMEPDRALAQQVVEVRTWPDGAPARTIATAHAHGEWIRSGIPDATDSSVAAPTAAKTGI